MDNSTSRVIDERFAAHLPQLQLALGDELSVSGVAGPYRIFQRVHGHRHSLDDAITGWYAYQKTPDARRFLDLGTGVGTVGLNVLWGLGESATMVCVEAQEISFALLSANIECNGLSQRVQVIRGDLRELALAEKVALITGSPPYFPINAGVLPTDSQKAHARFELRGNVGDYARAARQHLTEDGVFVFCFPAQQKSRCIKLVQDEGFHIATIRDVIPRAGKDPLFSLYSAKLQSVAATIVEPPFVVADTDGKYTDEMIAMQLRRGFGPDGTN